MDPLKDTLDRDDRWGVAMVDADWFNRAVAPLIDAPKDNSDQPVHMLTGSVREDAAGIWFTKIPTRFFDEGTQAPTVVDLLVPWRFLQSLGIERTQGNSSSNRTVGFRAASGGGAALTRLGPESRDK